MVCYGPKTKTTKTTTTIEVVMARVPITMAKAFLTATFLAAVAAAAAAAVEVAQRHLPQLILESNDHGMTEGSKGAPVEAKDLLIRATLAAAAVVVVVTVAVTVVQANGKGACVYATICQVLGTAAVTPSGTLRYKS